jgi:hypothetical protein
MQDPVTNKVVWKRTNYSECLTYSQEDYCDVETECNLKARYNIYYINPLSTIGELGEAKAIITSLVLRSTKTLNYFTWLFS